MGLSVVLPEVMLVALDRCILLSDHVALDPEYHILYDFTLLEPLHEMEKEENSHKEKETEQDKVDISKGISLNNDLVCHPLTRMLLERKWRMYGMYAYCSLFCSYLLFLALLTFVVVTGIQTRLIPRLLMASYHNVEHFVPNAVNSSGFQQLLLRAQMANASKDNAQLRTFFGAGVAVFLLLFFFLIKEIIELRSKGWRYFNDVVNYLEIVMIGCCMTFICSYLYEVHSNVDIWLTWQMGALTIFLAWFNLLRYCQAFGTFGMYAVMFFTVLKTLVKVSAFFFILTASFTVTFYGLLPTLVYPKIPDYYTTFSADEPPKARDLKTPHPNLYTSALRVGAMTIGDVDTISNYINPLTDGTLPFPIMTFIVLIVFFLMMPILLNNLLTGLAVGDITATMKLSLSHRLRNQIEVHRLIEVLLPQNVRRRWKVRLQCYKYYPNIRPGWLDEVSRWLAGGTKKDAAQWNRKLPVRGKKGPKGAQEGLTSRKKLLDDISSELRTILQWKKTKNIVNEYPEESSAIVGDHRESSASTLPVSTHSRDLSTAPPIIGERLFSVPDANRLPVVRRQHSFSHRGDLTDHKSSSNI
ncbi:hypothetical protein RvY_01225 [Ramazzottius varieornatus]|uniref:Ion transport domain-containing protein n=1 Tax=Ramazzottius varieornatus TaxID=947166 RepID=A0A1D1ULM2_RAMVA|nr:hypothetical protein RvY_01225 [Ramazzottius varieornatus]